MIISVDITEQDEKRLNELKTATEAATRSSVLREAIREYHKKIFKNRLTADSAARPAERSI